MGHDFRKWRAGDEAQVCRAGNGLPCLWLELMAVAMKIDLLIAEGECCTGGIEDNALHAGHALVEMA